MYTNETAKNASKPIIFIKPYNEYTLQAKKRIIKSRDLNRIALNFILRALTMLS